MYQSIRAAGARCDDHRSQSLKIEVCSQHHQTEEEEEEEEQREEGRGESGGRWREAGSLRNNMPGLPREDELTSEHRLPLNEIIDLLVLPRGWM